VLRVAAAAAFLAVDAFLLWPSWPLASSFVVRWPILGPSRLLLVVRRGALSWWPEKPATRCGGASSSFCPSCRIRVEILVINLRKQEDSSWVLGRARGLPGRVAVERGAGVVVDDQASRLDCCWAVMGDSRLVV
jgi:hypothetical protein